jgi:hypothetical protein
MITWLRSSAKRKNLQPKSLNIHMQIEPIMTQSITWTTVVNGGRTEIVRRAHEKEGNHVTVSEIRYYLYNSHGQVEQAQKGSQVDLTV